MKTLIIEQGETLGGAERYILDFVTHLSPHDRARLDLGILGASSEDYRSELPHDVAVLDFDLPSFKGNVWQKLKGGLCMIFLSRKLKKRITKTGAKVVLTNTPRASLFLYFARALWGLKCRWVAVVHDFHTNKKMYATVHKKLRKKMLNACDQIIAVSLITRQKVSGYLPPEAQKKIRIIENGIEIDTLPAFETKNKLENMVMVSRIDRRKGQMVLLQALEILKREQSEIFETLKVRIVGSSFAADEDTVAYEKSCREFNALHDLGVQFVGEVKNPFAEIAAADLLVMLPQVGETFGRVAIESLAVGTMVISANQDGPRQILRTYATAINVPAAVFLVEQNTPRALADKISSLKQVEKDLPVFTAGGRDFVVQNYNLAESRKRLFELLLG